MKTLFLAALFATYALNSQATERLEVKLEGIENGAPIAEKFANCVATDKEKSAPGPDVSPKITWSKGPAGTKSYAVVMVDRDVPESFDDANKDGKTIDAHAPRQNFYHWILVNIPTTMTFIPEGMGKDKNYGDQLLNSYMKFSGAKSTYQNIVKYSGYDGPCPPWNDERVHNYHFKVLALSTKFNPGENYDGDTIMKTLTPFVIAEGEVVGTYTLNKNINKTAPAINTPK